MRARIVMVEGVPYAEFPALLCFGGAIATCPGFPKKNRQQFAWKRLERGLGKFFNTHTAESLSRCIDVFRSITIEMFSISLDQSTCFFLTVKVPLLPIVLLISR